MKKRLVTSFISVAMALSLVACGSSSATPATPATNNDGSTTTEETSATQEAPEQTNEVSEANEPIALRAVAYNSIVAHLDSAIAKEAGYYDEEGLDVTMT